MTEVIDEQVTIDETPKTYEDTLQYTQKVRHRIVSHFTQDKIPDDIAELGIVLKALKDMDVSAIDKQRNTIEEQKSGNARAVAEAMAEFLNIQQNGNPFLNKNPGGIGQVPELDISKLGEHELVPGELEIDTTVEEADAFIQRMDIAHKEKLEKNI